MKRNDMKVLLASYNRNSKHSGYQILLIKNSKTWKLRSKIMRNGGRND